MCVCVCARMCRDYNRSLDFMQDQKRQFKDPKYATLLNGGAPTNQMEPHYNIQIIVSFYIVQSLNRFAFSVLAERLCVWPTNFPSLARFPASQFF